MLTLFSTCGDVRVGTHHDTKCVKFGLTILSCDVKKIMQFLLQLDMLFGTEEFQKRLELHYTKYIMYLPILTKTNREECYVSSIAVHVAHSVMRSVYCEFQHMVWTSTVTWCVGITEKLPFSFSNYALFWNNWSPDIRILFTLHPTVKYIHIASNFVLIQLA
jgi:hypothetical protein